MFFFTIEEYMLTEEHVENGGIQKRKIVVLRVDHSKPFWYCLLDTHHISGTFLYP